MSTITRTSCFFDYILFWAKAQCPPGCSEDEMHAILDSHPALLGDDDSEAISLIDCYCNPPYTLWLLADLRWGDTAICPRCDNSNVSRLIAPAHSTLARRRWNCRDCRRQFSVLTGSFFGKSLYPMEQWIALINILCHQQKKHTTTELSKLLETPQCKTWDLQKRVQAAGILVRRDTLKTLQNGLQMYDRKTN